MEVNECRGLMTVTSNVNGAAVGIAVGLSGRRIAMVDEHAPVFAEELLQPLEVKAAWITFL